MSVAEAQKNFETPAEPWSPLTIGELNRFLSSLPSLSDDASAFADDVRAIRAEFFYEHVGIGERNGTG